MNINCYKFKNSYYEIFSYNLQVSNIVAVKCKNQKEKDKFVNYISERDNVIKLLLKVAGLLARAENALQSLPEDSSETIKVNRIYFNK